MSLTSVSSSLRYVPRSRHVDGRHAMGYIDGFLTLVAGLALRVVIDAATFHSVKLSGSLIGLWEGVVLLHYVKKGAAFPDLPYLVCGIRVLVDFLVTEDVFKLVVVLLWATMGMVLGDVAPVVWAETGLKRQWSRFRRDLTRSARILFTQGPSTMASTPAETTPVIPPPPVVVKRPVPGTFPGAEWSETETGVGTAIYSDEDGDEFDEEGFEEGEEDEEEVDEDDDEGSEEGNINAAMPAHPSITIALADNDQEEEEADEDSNPFSLTTPPVSP